MRKILFLFLASLIIPIASATDWTYANPIGLGLTNIPSDQFMVTNNNASTGDIASVSFDTTGLYSQLIRINNCNNCLYGLINPVDGSVWGTDEQGNVFYTPNLFGTVDYSKGFFTAGFGGSCSGAGGNCNPLYKVTTLSAITYSRKLAVDSDGNIYVADRTSIYRIVRSLGYSPQTWYTLSYAEQVAQATVLNSNYIDVLDIVFDNSNNLHILAGSGTHLNTASYNSLTTIYLGYSVISPTGTTLYKNTSIRSDQSTPSCGCAFDNFWSGGGLVLHTSNTTSNFTYGATSSQKSGVTTVITPYLRNFFNGNQTILSSLAGVTQVDSIGYNDFQIYISSAPQNLIRSYVTNYEGFGVSTIASNPSGITGTFSWVNGYNTQINTITPGAALAYRWTISSDDANYTYFSGWSPISLSTPDQIQELTDLTGLGTPAVFLTNSNTLAGTDIFGFLLAKRKNDSTWSQLAAPTKLTISASVAGFDSITLDKTFYNLTGDIITATLTYSAGYPPYFYQWQLCSRADCADGTFFNTISLIAQPATSTMSTTGMARGNYYAVLMRHLPFLQNEIVASQRLEIRPPVIGVSWDKSEYNLYPKALTSVCLDSTPSVSHFTNISGYAGLQWGAFSCSQLPADASANNSIMRASLFARYNGTFYLNNSIGSIWNGTLNNGSGALIYALTNSSVTETWTLKGINQSGETFVATAEVKPESAFGYTLSVSPTTAYNQDTIYLTFTKPIYALSDYVEVRDAGGLIVVSFPSSAKSGSYYIDPSKQYTYGTWTSYWKGGGVANQFGFPTHGETIFTFTVKNAGKPKTNASVIAEGSAEQTSSELVALIQSKIFWTLVFVVGLMLVVSMRERRGQ